MSSQNRRAFLKAFGAVGAGVVCLDSKLKAQNLSKADTETRMGVLVDTTTCIGCRSCEWACKKAHNIETESLSEYQSNREVFKKPRKPNEKALTVVNEFNVDNTNLPIDVKVQCMHCEDPACVASCIVHAFTKHEDGTVNWDGDKCIGCRYCMVACPFQIPVFEYEKALQPNIVKCDFCFERTSKEKLPACVEICPVEAITYGKREELIRIARTRIKNNPGKYVNHIYGEHEVGGTSWLYLSSAKFNKLDFPILGEDSAPGISKQIQHGLFRYFVPPLALYALLGGIMWISKKRENKEGV